MQKYYFKEKCNIIIYFLIKFVTRYYGLKNKKKVFLYNKL